MSQNTFSNINEIAGAIISEVLSANDPFARQAVACNNSKVKEWFKAYFLKHSGVLLMCVFVVNKL